MVSNRTLVGRGLKDLISLFKPLPSPIPGRPEGKRILVFNWRDQRHVYAGGAELYVHELSRRWVEQGHAVTLFCGRDGSTTPRRETLDGVKIVRRGGFWLVYVWAMLYYLIRFRGSYDVIVDCHNGIPFFTPLYAGVPVVGVVHHIHQEVFKRHLPAPAAALARWLEGTLMPWAYRRCQLIAVSESTKQDMLALGLKGAGIHIVHNGVDLDDLYPATKADTPLVVYLGRLKAYKSVDVLVRAFHEVTMTIPGAKLVIAGPGEELNRLKALAAKLGLTRDQIEFKGRVSDNERRRLLQRAWVFVNPSLMEGWGITTIEANACGTPVVGANVAGLRDSIQNPHTGYLVPHGDHAAFAGRVRELLTDHAQRDFMSRNAVEWANQFKWDDSSRRALHLIEGEAR